MRSSGRIYPKQKYPVFGLGIFVYIFSSVLQLYFNFAIFMIYLFYHLIELESKNINIFFNNYLYFIKTF